MAPKFQRRPPKFKRRVRSWSPRSKVKAPAEFKTLSAVEIQGPIAAPGGSTTLFTTRDF